ncbi:MAG: M23 family metallopeptidase [bacterium]
MKRFWGFGLLALVLLFSGWARARESLPYKLASRADQDEIQRFRGSGKDSLAFELLLENYHSKALSLDAVQLRLLKQGKEVFVQELKDEGLRACFSGVQDNYHKAQDPILAPGSAGILFLWLDLPDTVGPVDRVETRLVVQEQGKPGSPMTLEGPSLTVSARPLRVISPPLRGTLWWTPNGPANNSTHRRVMIPLSGQLWVPERFAVDWIQLGEDGKSYAGAADRNASYHAYGKPILSVAPGTVVKVKDGIPENVPNAKQMAVPIDLETIGGNYVIVDIGGGLFAFYAHLQPGTIKVKVGDAVAAGQTLGLLGNSGNSSEPHLHFHLIDRPDPLRGQGQPFALDRWLQIEEGVKTDADDNPIALNLNGKKSERKNQIYGNLDLAEFP